MLSNYTNFIEKSMDASAQKRKIISDNIANYNTPNFKASKVEFENMLNEGSNFDLTKTKNKHLSMNDTEGEIKVIKDLKSKERTDGNNVDLNIEMMEMIKNNYAFNLNVQAINKEFGLIKMAIGK